MDVEREARKHKMSLLSRFLARPGKCARVNYAVT